MFCCLMDQNFGNIDVVVLIVLGLYDYHSLGQSYQVRILCSDWSIQVNLCFLLVRNLLGMILSGNLGACHDYHGLCQSCQFGKFPISGLGHLLYKHKYKYKY